MNNFLDEVQKIFSEFSDVTIDKASQLSLMLGYHL